MASLGNTGGTLAPEAPAPAQHRADEPQRGSASGGKLRPDRLPDDVAGEATYAPMRVRTDSQGGGQPLGPLSTKVAWSLRDAKGKIIAGTFGPAVFAWNINPQGLTRNHSSRNQLYATKAGFYVDDFGPGPVTIQLRQLVASGPESARGAAKAVPSAVFGARADVQKFLRQIYVPATIGGPRATRPSVFFHDNHLSPGHDERVYFPANAVDIQRSVDLHNVWLVQIVMIGLEAAPYADVPQPPGSSSPATPAATTRGYTVKSGDTLHKIALQLAGAGASPAKVRTTLARLMKANPRLAHNRTVDVKSGDLTKHVRVKGGSVTPGEKITVPA